MLRRAVGKGALHQATDARQQTVEWCLRLSRAALFVTLVVLPSPAFVEIVPRQIGTLEPHYRSHLLYVSDVPLVIAVLAWATAHLLAPARPARLGPWYVAGPALALLALSVLSPLWAPVPPIALETAVRTVALFAFYLIAANDARSSPLIAAGLVVGLIVNAPIAVAQFLTQGPVGLGAIGELTWYETTPGAWLRGYGLTMHPNVLGGFLALGLLGLVGIGLRQWRGSPLPRRGGRGDRVGAGRRIATVPLALLRWPRFPAPGNAERVSPPTALAIAQVGVLALGAIGLLSTFSRSAWLGLVGGLLYLGLLGTLHSKVRWVRRPLLGQVVVLVCVAIAFAVPYHPLIATRILLPTMSIVRQEGVPGAELELNVIEERNTLHRAAATLIVASPLLGVGAGNFTVAYYQREGQSDPSRLYQPEHNVPLLVAAELGPIGALAWLLLAVAPIVVLARRPASGASTWLYVWAAALLAVLIISQFDFYFWGRQQGRALFWALIGAWVAAHRQADDPPPIPISVRDGDEERTPTR